MSKRRGHNIDHDFAEAMRSIGGKPPIEIDPTCQDEKFNADIVFQIENAITEIKTLMEDPRDQNGYEKGLKKLYSRWVREGKVPAVRRSTLKINAQDLPEDCGHEFVRWTMRSVRRSVEKANKQIKGLKDTLKMPDAKG